MTTSPSEPVDEQGLGDDDLDQTTTDETEHDQDSEPTSTAPAEGNPTVPGTDD
jgi:hypothetical protein